MKSMIIVWLLGLGILLGVFVAPTLRVAFVVGSALYLIGVMFFCYFAARDLTANVQWIEQQLATVRHGTVTEKNAPLV